MTKGPSARRSDHRRLGEYARGPGALDRDSPLPLWAQLLDDLRRRLRSGEFGETFPSELALAGSYAVSRNTVREAVRRLRGEGAVVSGRGLRPRTGPTAQFEQPLGALYSLFRSVEEAGLEQRSIVRALSTQRDEGVAARLGLDPQTDLLFLDRIRLAGGEPLAVDQVWFPADVAGPLLDADFTRTAFYDELLARTGVRLTGGEERIHAVVPTRAERTALGVTAQVAALAIDRLGFAADRPLEWRHTLVRGDRFGVVARFTSGGVVELDLAASGRSLQGALA
ncbi:MAG: GntR family transcriptional regulator [Acidimicrobiales bacterium]